MQRGQALLQYDLDSVRHLDQQIQQTKKRKNKMRMISFWFPMDVL